MFIKVVNSILRITFLLSIRYFTAWVFCFHILYHLGILKNYQYSLLLLSIIVSVIGGYITYIYPKKMNIVYLNINIEGIGLKLFDLLFHHFPFLILLYRYNSKIKKDNLMLALIMLIIYLLINDPFNIYNIILCKST